MTVPGLMGLCNQGCMLEFISMASAYGVPLTIFLVKCKHSKVTKHILLLAPLQKEKVQLYLRVDVNIVHHYFCVDYRYRIYIGLYDSNKL